MIIDNYLVKIIDFGMSKKVNSCHQPQLEDNIAGTVAYMVLFYLLLCYQL